MVWVECYPYVFLCILFIFLPPSAPEKSSPSALESDHDGKLISGVFFSQATLEIEFMQQTLGRYVTPTASKTLSDLYNRISQAYSRRPGDESLQANLDDVKKTLADSRRSTAFEFLCFKQTKQPSSHSNKTSGTRNPVKGNRAKNADVISIPAAGT